MDNSPEPKTWKMADLYKKLNKGAVEFFKLQERYAFPFLCIWIVFGGIISIWTFIQYVEQGGGFMPFVVASIILFVLVLCFYMDWEYVKDKSDRIRFWKPWILVFLLPVIICIATFGQRLTKQNYESEIGSTNTYYGDKIIYLNSKISGDEEAIKELRQAYAGKPHRLSDAELMGFHDETNIVVTTNLITKSVVLTNIAIFYTTHPVLDFLQMERIKSKLVYTPSASIQVLAQMNDDAAIGLAKQIGQTFLAAGFNPTVGGFDVNSHVAHNGVTFSAKTIPTNSIAEAYIQLNHELLLPLSWNVDTSAPNANFSFLVTTTHK